MTDFSMSARHSSFAFAVVPSTRLRSRVLRTLPERGVPPVVVNLWVDSAGYRVGVRLPLVR